MDVFKVVLDTNVLVAALRSRNGAAFKLLSLIDQGLYQPCISVPLMIEYEDVLKRGCHGWQLTNEDIDDVLNYICAVSQRQQIFFLWRPFLKDPKDDLVLELAVQSNSDYIITFNKKDFAGIGKFGLAALTPKEFLQLGGVIE